MDPIEMKDCINNGRLHFDGKLITQPEVAEY